MAILNTALIERSALKGLTTQQIETLDRCAALVQFQSGNLIFEQGKDALRFYLIQSGKVSLELYTPERGPRPIQTIDPGDLLGSSWIVPPYKWQCDARALGRMEAIAFDARRVQAECQADHELGFELLSRFFIAISRRLDTAQKKILEMYTKHE